MGIEQTPQRVATPNTQGASPVSTTPSSVALAYKVPAVQVHVSNDHFVRRAGRHLTTLTMHLTLTIVIFRKY